MTGNPRHVAFRADDDSKPTYWAAFHDPVALGVGRRVADRDVPIAAFLLGLDALQVDPCGKGLLIGNVDDATFKHGAVVGKTNANGTQVTDREVDHGHLFHTYLRAVGVKSAGHFTINDRPTPIADPARSAIDEILA